ncbi:MAG TPA: hypothetical protein VF449_06645 [Parvibaculum sp.]
MIRFSPLSPGLFAVLLLTSVIRASAAYADVPPPYDHSDDPKPPVDCRLYGDCPTPTPPVDCTDCGDKGQGPCADDSCNCHDDGKSGDPCTERPFFQEDKPVKPN